jgi:hypothetical protein
MWNRDAASIRSTDQGADAMPDFPAVQARVCLGDIYKTNEPRSA